MGIDSVEDNVRSSVQRHRNQGGAGAQPVLLRGAARRWPVHSYGGRRDQPGRHQRRESRQRPSRLVHVRCLRRPAGVSHGCSCSPVEAVTAELHTSRSSALRWLVFVLLAGAYKEHSRRIVAVSNRSQTAGQTAVTRTMLWLPIHHFFFKQLATSLVRNSLITTN